MQLILPIEFLQKRPNSQSLGLWELGAIKQSLKGSPNGQNRPLRAPAKFSIPKFSE